MSSIDSTGITLASDYNLADCTQSTQSKEMNELIQNMAAQRMRISKLTEECSFVRDLHICLLSPANFTNSSVYARLIKKFGTPSEVQKVKNEWRGCVTEFKQLDQLIKIDENLCKLFKGIFDSKFINEKKQALAKNDGALNFIDTLLNKMAIESTLTAEDWNDFQDAFERKNLTFSQDFINRCQQAAQRAIAA